MHWFRESRQCRPRASKRLANRIETRAPQGGTRCRAHAARKHLDAEALLEALDATAHGALRDAQLFARGAKALEAPDASKMLKDAQRGKACVAAMNLSFQQCRGALLRAVDTLSIELQTTGPLHRIGRRCRARLSLACMASITEKVSSSGLVLPVPPVRRRLCPFVRAGNLTVHLGSDRDGEWHAHGGWAGRIGCDGGTGSYGGARHGAMRHRTDRRGGRRRSLSCEAHREVVVFIAAAPGFSDHPQVANGASDLLVAVFGNEGRHARSAVGVSSLPRGAAVEIEAVVELESVSALEITSLRAETLGCAVSAFFNHAGASLPSTSTLAADHESPGMRIAMRRHGSGGRGRGGIAPRRERVPLH